MNARGISAPCRIDDIDTVLDGSRARDVRRVGEIAYKMPIKIPISGPTVFGSNPLTISTALQVTQTLQL